MDVKVNGGCLTNAIATEEINQLVTQFTDQLGQQATTILEQFALSNPTPERMLDLENSLNEYL